MRIGDFNFDPLQLRRTYARGLEEARARELAYGRGAVPLVELVDARRTLRSVLLDQIAARADHARALAAWQLRAQP